MPIFQSKPGRGQITHLVLQDAEQVWARAEDGVLKISDEAAERFRAVAAEYGFTETDTPDDDTPAPVAPAVPAESEAEPVNEPADAETDPSGDDGTAS